MKAVFFIQRKRDIPYLIDFCRGNPSTEVVCVATEPRAASLADEMRFTVRSFSDYISPQEIVGLSLTADEFSRVWGRVGHLSELDGHLLSEFLEWDYRLFLSVLLGTELLFQVLKREKPDRFVVINDGSYLCHLVFILCGKENIKAEKVKRDLFKESIFFLSNKNIKIDWSDFLEGLIRKLRSDKEIKSLPVYRKSKLAKRSSPRKTGTDVLVVLFRLMLERILPVIEELRRRGIVIKILMLDLIDKPPDERELRKHHLPYFFLGDYYEGNLKEDFRKEKLLFQPRWERFSRSACGRFSYRGINLFPLLDGRFKRNFLYWFPRFTISARALKKAMEIESPKLLIGVDDRADENRLAFRIAKELDIPTLLVPHGLLDGKYFLHSIADMSAAWSEGTREQYGQLGVDVTKMEFVGSPMLDMAQDHRFLTREEIGARLGARSLGNYILYLPSAHYYVNTQLNKFNIVVRSMAVYPELQFVVKLHSSDGISEYEYRGSADQGYPRIFFTRSVDVLSLVRESKLVITELGTAILEVMMVDIDKPLIFLDLEGLARLEHEPLAAPDYYEHRAFRIVSKTEDLGPALKEELDYRGERRKEREEFLRKYGGPVDGGSAERIADLVERMIARK